MHDKVATKTKKINGSVDALAEALRCIIVLRKIDTDAEAYNFGLFYSTMPAGTELRLTYSEDLHNKMLDPTRAMTSKHKVVAVDDKVIEVDDKVDRMATENKMIAGGIVHWCNTKW